MSHLEKAASCLVDAERYADDGQCERSQAYTAVANAWIRIAELKTQEEFVTYFERKSFR